MAYPTPYSFLPIRDDSDEETPLPPPGTMFANRKRHSYSNSQDSSSNSGNQVDRDQTKSQTPRSATSRLTGEDSSFWCRCGKCKRMPTELELKCWYDEKLSLTNIQDPNFKPGRDCILSANVITNQVLSIPTLQLLWFSSMRYKGATGDALLFSTMKNENFRFHAYRSYINYMHGYLGRKNRKVIPACVVAYIRDMWPDRHGTYTGYKEADEDDEQQPYVPVDELEGRLEEA